MEKYRGVTNLCPMAKIVDVCFSEVFLKNVHSNLSQFQHGFMPHRSTTTNLLQFPSFAITAIELGAQVDTIYFDFAKAFDRVNILILLRKLRSRTNVAFNIIKWLESYLNGRYQRVKIGNSISEPFPVTSGVGQGSHSFFIDDLADFLQAMVLFLLFTDDLKIYAAIRTHEDAMRLQAAINAIIVWCDMNELGNNAEKCNVVSYGRKRDLIQFMFCVMSP